MKPTPLVLIAWLLLFSPAAAQETKEKQEVQVTGLAGWAGYCTRGDWTPALIDLDNRGKKDLDLVISVTWAAPFSAQSSPNPSLDNVFGRVGPVHQIPVSLPAKARKRLSVSLRTPDSYQSSIWVFAQEAAGGRTVARGELLVRQADPQQRIIGVVGQSRPEGLLDVDHVIVGTLQADELPEDWQGYTSLSALVWLDGRANELRSTAQMDALKKWISAGGQFYVARANMLNFAGTPVADLLPVKVGPGRELESLGENNFPVGPALVLENTLKSGVVRALAHGVPLVTEGSRDAGRVTFIAFDPARPPFPDSPQAKTFWSWLLRLGPVGPPDRLDEDRAPSVIGSLAIAQYAGRFPDIAAPEIGGLFLLIILYLVVVGPLDYFLLRGLKKLEYTWFTFPAYVILFTLFILLVGGAFIQRSAHQREIVVEDYYPDSGFRRSRALSAVLAPADILYKVHDAEPISSNFIDQNRAFDTGGPLSDVRFVQGPVAENWLLNRNYTGLAISDRCDGVPAPLSYTITHRDNVEVRLTVKNTTGKTFTGSTLVLREGAYWISAIAPGETQVSGSKTSATLQEYLEQETIRASRRPRYARYNGDDLPDRIGTSEQVLNPQVRKALMGVSFAPPGPETEPFTGFARSLQARAWIDSGGSVLCVWPDTGPASVRFEPTPGRLTAVTLHRFFQGPPR